MSDKGTQDARSSDLRAGQVWRSLRLRDYSVKLVRPASDDRFWIVEPQASSAHGKYTARADVLARADLYALESVPGRVCVTDGAE